MTTKSLRHGARIGRKIHKAYLWAKIVLLAVVCGYLLVSAIFTAGTLIHWFDQHTLSLQSPILMTVKYQSLIKVTDNMKEASRTAMLIKPVEATTEAKLAPVEEYDIVMQQPHGSILWNIFARESNRGMHDVCRSRGTGFNGLGLGESDEYIRLHGANCFPSMEALWTRAEKAIVEFGVKTNKSRAICRWKYGTQFMGNTCEYAEEVLSMK